MIKFLFDLQRFADAGAGAEASASVVENGGDDSHKEDGLFETAADNSEQNIENKEPEKASFQDLITGDYKADFDNAVQNIVKKRVKGMQSQINDTEPLLNALKERYGLKEGTPQQILEAMMDDDGYYEQEALESGMDVETVKRIHKLERENAEFNRQLQERNAEEENMKFWANVSEQADELRNIYPEFNLETELSNEDFGHLLQSGVDVKTAFEVVHHDQLIPQAMKFVADKTAQKISNSIKANRARPSEGGTTQPLKVRKDWRSLSPEQRDELNKRIMEGEEITI